MGIEFNTSLVKKVKKYCKINSSQENGGKGSRKALYLAEEATSEVLTDLFEKRDTYFKDRELTDNLLFMICKYKIKNLITKENAKKRTLYKDNNSINLDVIQNNSYFIELVDESTEEDYIEEVKTKEETADMLLERINNILSENSNVRESDKNIFYLYFIEGYTQKTISKMKKTSTATIHKAVKRIRTALIYEMDLDGEQVKLLKYSVNKSKPIEILKQRDYDN